MSHQHTSNDQPGAAHGPGNAASQSPSVGAPTPRAPGHGKQDGNAPPVAESLRYAQNTLGTAWKIYSQNFGDFFRMYGPLMVGGSTLAALLWFTPLLWPLATLVSLAVWFLLFFYVSAMSAEYCLRLLGGRPMTVGEVHERQKAQFLPQLVSTFVAGLFCWTFVLGVYLFQVKRGEARQGFDINERVFHLFKNDWKRIVATTALLLAMVIAGWVALSLVQSAISAISVGLLGYTGAVLSSLLFAAVSGAYGALVVSFFMLLSTLLYLDTRTRVEGASPLAQILSTLDRETPTDATQPSP